jgi:hypothetical protein
MPWVAVMMDGKRFEALTHALHEIGFKPTTGKPYQDEIDVVWRSTRAALKRGGFCTISRNGREHEIKLCGNN